MDTEYEMYFSSKIEYIDLFRSLHLDEIFSLFVIRSNQKAIYKGKQ